MALDHYVSQVHLKNFYSADLGNRMYAIRKSDMAEFTPRARDVCRLEEGNTNEYLLEPRAIESFLVPIENNYNSAVAELKQGRPSQGAIYVASGFVSYVLTCSPTAMRICNEPLIGQLEAFAQLAEANGQFPEIPADLGGDAFAELLDRGEVRFDVDPRYPQAIVAGNILRSVVRIGNFNWEILVNEHRDSPFFTSDFPIAIEQTDNTGVVNRVVSLSPELAVRIHPNFDIADDNIDVNFSHFNCVTKNISRQEACYINRLLVRSAEDLVFYRQNPKWLRSFVEKNRHFHVGNENIEIGMRGRRAICSRHMIKPLAR